VQSTDLGQYRYDAFSMNPPESQGETEPASTYFDPEAPDMSEQQFSASLEFRVERPKFVVDVPAAEAVDEDLIVAPALDPPEATSDAPTQGAAEQASPDRLPSEDSVVSPTAADGEAWRDLVSAKINTYRSRKPRIDRYPSLQLQFEQRTYRNAGSFGPELNSSKPLSQLVGIDSTAIDSSPPTPAISTEAAARVLEFPRANALPVRQDELADPVLDRPRIVEAPEALPSPPAMGGILIESVEEPEPERRPGFDMPLQSAPLSRRLLAGGTDALGVATAIVIFEWIVVQVAGPLTFRASGELALGLLILLWPAYQYCLLIFSGTTPGLRVSKLAVTRFDGTPAPKKLRRWRVLASLLSCVSFGLGYAWCFLDEDQLSWHDRITRTHLAPSNLASGHVLKS
jgi:uncharacterized RDD family membrane protein YckC